MKSNKFAHVIYGFALLFSVENANAAFGVSCSASAAIAGNKPYNCILKQKENGDKRCRIVLAMGYPTLFVDFKEVTQDNATSIEAILTESIDKKIISSKVAKDLDGEIAIFEEANQQLLVDPDYKNMPVTVSCSTFEVK